MSIISGFYKVKNYVKTTEGYKILSRLTSSDSVDVNGKTLTEVVNELGTAAKKDVAASGNASITQVVMGNDTRLTDDRKASDVSAWAKASTKPTYTASEVGAYTKTETDTKLNGKANSSHTHGNGDITSLDAGKITSGTISIDRLPQGALDRLIKVVDDTARFKLTTKDVQLGDSVKVTSTKKMYIVVDETKLSSEDGYEPYTADSATSVPWSGVTGKPSTYTPSSHTHTKSQITDFPTSMPANGGNSSTVNGHIVNSNVPANAKFTDTNTWIAFKGATTSAAGIAGYAPAPAAGAANRYLRSDGTWSVPPDTNTTYPAATQSAQGLMSAADKKKLDGIASGANAYSLPTASASTLGGIKVGSNLSISNGVLSATNSWRGISDTYSSSITNGSGTSLSQKGAYDMYTELNGNLKINSITSIVKSDVINKIVIWQNYTIGNIFVGTFSINVGASNLPYNDCIIATGFPKPFNGDVPVYAKSTSHIYQCTITKNGELKTLWTDAAIQANSNIMLETCYAIKNL